MNNLNGIDNVLTTILTNLKSQNQIVNYHHQTIEKIKSDLSSANSSEKEKDDAKTEEKISNKISASFNETIAEHLKPFVNQKQFEDFRSHFESHVNKNQLETILKTYIDQKQLEKSLKSYVDQKGLEELRSNNQKELEEFRMKNQKDIEELRANNQKQFSDFQENLQSHFDDKIKELSENKKNSGAEANLSLESTVSQAVKSAVLEVTNTASKITPKKETKPRKKPTAKTKSEKTANIGSLSQEEQSRTPSPDVDRDIRAE